MRIARAAMIGIVGVAAMALAGCGDDGRVALWRKMTDSARSFLAVVPCGARIEFPTTTFYEMLSSRWLFDDPYMSECRKAFCGGPGKFAVRATIVDGYGATRDIKVWTIGNFETWGGLAAKHGVQLWSAIMADSEHDKTCASVVTIPWENARNRPFWVADETLRINPAPLAANKDHLGFVWRGLVGLIMIGTLFVATAPEAKGRRGLEIFTSLLVAAVGCFFLFFVQAPWIVTPYERLLGAQSYYRFFATLPQVGGHLLPVSSVNLQAMWQGPPLTTGPFYQEVEKFWVAAFCVLALWLVSYWQRLCMGFHFLFVRHPADPYVLLCARRRGLM